MTKSIMCTVLFFVLLALPVAAESEPVFSKVHQVMYDENNDAFVITDNGVWQIVNQRLIQVGGEGSAPVSYALSDYQDLFPDGAIKQGSIHDLASIGYVILLVLFSALYLYYQSALNKRRKAFYQRIKVQQQILSIAFLATGEEVLDCDIAAGTVERLNKNANFNLPEGIYFQSQDFIETLHPDDSSAFIAQFESLITGSRDNYELNYRVRNGQSQWLWVAERGMVIERDTQGKAKRLISSMRDITSIKNEQEQLHRVIAELETRLKQARVIER